MTNTHAASATDTPLLEVEGLGVDFNLPTGTVQAVDAIDFTVHTGKVMALVGESGSGKSVTANALLRLLPDFARIRGRARFEGHDLLSMSDRDMRRIRGCRISMIFQEPMTSLNPLHRIGRQIEEVMAQHTGLSRTERRARALHLLDQVGIPEPERRINSYPGELSGGQRQRVMIAMALACDPKLLIADEPTTALDVTVQAQILELLRSLQKEHDMAVIFITHDLSLVERFADSVCVMQHGKLIEQGAVAEVFSRPQAPYTRQLLEATPTGSKAPVDPSAPTLLSSKDLRVRFTTKRRLLRANEYFEAVKGIDLTVKRGQTLGIVGESGSGKSTLGRALLRLIKSRGEITFDGQRIDGLDKHAMRPLRSRMQVVFQDPYGSLSPRMTVGEIISEGLKVHMPHLNRQERDARITEVLEEVALDPTARYRYPHEFSGGQRQRIAIARAIVLKPELLLLDEPTSALDRSVQARIILLLRELQEKYALTYIFISHDLGVVRALSDTILVMQAGKVVEAGETQALFDAPREPYTRSLLKAAFLSD